MKFIIKTILFPLLILVICVKPAYTQNTKIFFHAGGGLGLPNMKDINDIYFKEHHNDDNLNKINFLGDISTSIGYRFLPKFSLIGGLDYIFHNQKANIQTDMMVGEQKSGEISFKIKSYVPYIGIRYHLKNKSKYNFDCGFNILYCMVKLDDVLPDAAQFFSHLKSTSLGLSAEFSVKHYFNKFMGLGIQIGYRFLNISELKIDSNQYLDEPEDITYKINDNTIDLNLSGPFLRFLVLFKI